MIKAVKSFFEKLFLTLLMASLIFVSSIVTANASVASNFKVFVMGPLEKVTDFNAFKNQLITLKNNGVYGITTDIWWGYVENAGENQFDWSYYKTYADTVRAAGLKWVPIMSTHACGGNVGDTVNIPIPSWVWTKDTQDNMQYKDEAGNWDNEAVSPWYSGLTQLYNEFYSSFASNFSSYKDIIAKIYISGGPSGELRYPSYNPSHGWTYPGRGSLQCYSKAAITSFQNAMKSKYGTIAAVNSAWGTNLTDFSQISPPTDGDNFFTNGYKTTYGNDFLTWYQSVLTNELANIASVAHSCFDPVFNVPIGAKIAGVHWLYNSPTMPHAAEYCAGYYNYSTLLDQFKASNLAMTFTCLEMDDSNAYVSPYYSAPMTLVHYVANLANNKGIVHNGENALAISNNNQAYVNCANELTGYNFSGFTLLRLSNIVNSDGSVTSEMAPFVINIVTLTPNGTIPVTFTINNATTYYGQNVYIVGSTSDLGNWNTTYARGPASCPNYPTWTITLNLLPGEQIQFKAVKIDSSGNITWEGGSNHTYTVPTSGTGNVTFTWQN